MEDYYIKAYETFLKKWGYDVQSNMCIEEMSELTKALLKYIRYGKTDAPQEIKDNVLEEIADVLNTVEQMAYVFGKEKIEKIRKQKIDKTINRINSENSKK